MISVLYAIGYYDLPLENFQLKVPNIFVGGPFSVSLISGIEKFSAFEVNITIFYRIFVVSQYQKTSLGNPSVFHKLSGIEKIHG